MCLPVAFILLLDVILFLLFPQTSKPLWLELSDGGTFRLLNGYSSLSEAAKAVAAALQAAFTVETLDPLRELVVVTDEESWEFAKTRFNWNSLTSAGPRAITSVGSSVIDVPVAVPSRKVKGGVTHKLAKIEIEA